MNRNSKIKFGKELKYWWTVKHVGCGSVMLVAWMVNSYNSWDYPLSLVWISDNFCIYCSHTVTSWLEKTTDTEFNPFITGCLLAVWLMVTIAISRRETWKEGIVSWIFSVSTIVILLLFLIKGVTLPGSNVGLEKIFAFFSENIWQEIASVDLWLDALGQVRL